MVYRIERVKVNDGYYDVLLKDGTWFEIRRPEFSNIDDTIGFQLELLRQGIHFVEVNDLMLSLIVGMLFEYKAEVYHRV